MRATRFAPSPTGYLHRGHAFSALTAFETANRLGGRFVLRIEDIDFTRCRPEFEAAILEDLAWLGLDWEWPVLRQSDQMADYHAAPEGYRGARLAADVEAERLAAGEPFAWRLDLAAAERAAGPLSFIEAGE